MKLVIAGTRTLIVQPEDIWGFVVHNKLALTVEEIVSGGAKGIDTSAIDMAKVLGIPYKVFDPDWTQHGKAAGPIRNAAMADYGDALLLIWNGKSKGSASMKREMLKQNKPIYEVIVK
jgi:hypothetical protein